MDEAGVDRIPRCLRLEVDAVLEGLGEDDTIVPDAGLPAIGAQLARRREFFAAILEKDNPALAMVLEELDAEGMPRLFHYLALVESAYRPDAVSHAGAAGVWQFIPATARRYRLEVSTRVDERRDPRLATRAAVAYLRDLRARFVDFEGALLLAIASYNYGERRVEHALRRLDDAFGASPYWELVERDLLPRETQEYVPRFFAAAVAGEAGLPSEGVMRAAGY